MLELSEKGATMFSSPIFGDMFLLTGTEKEISLDDLFSSPIFGDMFLLK